jgi:hypothetical protein
MQHHFHRKSLSTIGLQIIHRKKQQLSQAYIEKAIIATPLQFSQSA